jgi:putative ABC transport system ATP-binding protein
MIKMTDLTKTYRAAEVETTALNGINVHIERGEFVAVMGPSGCGKSTFLNVVGMLDAPTSGQYLFGDEDISNYAESRLAGIRKKRIGFVFQSFNLIDELTVEENIALPLLYQKMDRAQRAQRAAEVMERVGIAHRAGHHPQQLSGGQQQRVAVARAVITQPDLILADEPTGNLDSKNGEEVMELLTQLNGEGTTVVMVTHSPSHADYARRVINLFDGCVVTENVTQLRDREVAHA